MNRISSYLALACFLISCSVPSFNYQTPTQQTMLACRDGRLSPGEADVDCGQSCDTPCASGLTCVADLDCASAFCEVGVCTDTTCTDALKNQGESDIDCGGQNACPRCASEKACEIASDCASGICTSGVCRPPQTCGDQRKDQDESDVDCGGKTGCERCAPGEACLSALDCDGGGCMAGTCHAPSCDDSLKNQTESDVDCGGSCPVCATGKTCTSATDCDLALCTGGKCRAQTCSDGILNQDESDLDCGGVTGCARCATSLHCLTSSDCNQANCSGGICQPTSCSDGVTNGSETDKDCGGTCPKKCAALAGCLLAQDCTSLVCTAATHLCAAASCTDGVLNGTEPTVDCGASCSSKCKVADTCSVASDCATGKCTNLHCVPTSASNGPLTRTGWLASASATEKPESAPHYALDGDLNTHWTTGAPQVPGMWFLVDMLTPQVFFSVTVTATSVSSDYGKTLRLSGSLDGKTFTELQTNIAGEQSLKIQFSEPQYARYLKLETLVATDGLWWRIDELNVLQ